MDPESSGFAEFYAGSRDMCLRAVYASVGDKQLAEELTAEAFARAWAHWRTVSRHAAPRAWVVKAALNASVSWWRHRRREVAVPDVGAIASGAAWDGDRLTAVGTGGAVTAMACMGILALAGALPTGSSQAQPAAGAANSATGAWTVTAGAGHSLHITFNRWPQQRADANRLQAALRADGVRIRVFVPPNSMSVIPAACAPAPYDRAASEYAGLSFTGKKTASSLVPGTSRDHLTIFVRPAPPGIGLYLELTPANWQAGILRATPSCM